MNTSLVPLERLRQRVARAKDESDAEYFSNLLYMGEFALKFLVLEMLAGIQDDRENHRYAIESQILRADGIGGWVELLDEALTGPASQHLVNEARESQKSFMVSLGVQSEVWQRQAVNLLNEACRIVDPQREDLSARRVDLRQWTRSFAWLRNRTRGHGALSASKISAMCQPLCDSIEYVVTNAPAFSRSWAHLHRNLSGKFRVTSFGGDRTPFLPLTHERDWALQDGCHVFLDTPRATPLIFTDPDLSDFFLPNGNFRKNSFEVLSYITGDTRTENGKAWEIPAKSRVASETAAKPDLDIVGKVFSNIPPRREGYIERIALQVDLTRLLEDDRHPMITLQGRGGVGKTSLALEVLHQLAERGDFFAIVWFSARDIDLLQHGPRVVRPDVLSTEDIARDFARLWSSMAGRSLSDSLDFLAECLSGQAADGPFLFVFDNFETIRDPAELYAFLDNAVRPPNKVLITTRTRDFKADYPIEVRGMNRVEFGELVAETVIRLGVSSIMDASYEDTLFEESDGHPYIAKILLGEVAREGRQVAPRRIIATRESMLDALFERSFSSLSPAAQRVFLTLCGWRSFVPRIGLEAVLCRPANENIAVDAALTELEKTSLIESHSSDGKGEDFLSVPLAASLFGKKKLVTSAFKIAIETDLQLIHGFGVSTTTELVHGVGPRVERLAYAAARRVEEGADIGQEIAVIKYIASEYPPAWLVLADLQQSQLSNLPGAIESTSRYLESTPGDEKAWRKLVQLYEAARNPMAEMNARLQLAELCNPPIAELTSAAARLSGLLRRSEIVVDADEKRHMILKLRTLIEQRADEADATDLSRLAWLCMYVQDFAAAEKWTNEGLRIDPANDHCLGLKRRLATVGTNGVLS